MTADLTAADLPRVVIHHLSSGKIVTADKCSDGVFARWLYTMTREFTRFDIAYPEAARVMWCNVVNRRRPVELLPAPGIEDDRL